MARPLADPAKVALGLKLLLAGDPERAVKQSGLSLRTLYRARTAAEKKAASKSTKGKGTKASKPVKVTKSAEVSDQLPQGGSVSGKPDLLVLVRRILKARNPAALAELDEGLALQARGGDDLEAWLVRPMAAPVVDIEVDPLVILADAAARMKMRLEQLPPDAPKANVLASTLAVLAKGLEAIRKGRPAEPTEDEVLAQLTLLDVACKKEIELYVAAAEEDAAQPRPGAPFGVCITCSSPLLQPLPPPP